MVTLACILPVQAQTWRPVAAGILNGISGMALIEQGNTTTSFLVIHDNKNDGENRVGKVTVRGSQQPEYTLLEWSQYSLPKDLEALTTIPGKPNQFLALTSSGELYHLRLIESQRRVEVLKVVELPKIAENSNFEGLALQEINGRSIIAWAHRGDEKESAVLYWTEFDLTSYTFVQPIHRLPLKMPGNLDNLRHISDLKIDPSGAVFATSANDPGNNGPFASAFYLIGNFQVCLGKINFSPSKDFVPFLRFKYHKIEAFELLPGANGGLVFTTDDENFGSSLYFTGE